SGSTLNQLVDYCGGSPILNHMVEYQALQIGSVFHALGDATRRRMLRELAVGERTVSELAEPFAMALAAASKHIKVRENAGLFRPEVRGRVHFCRLDPGPLATVHQWLGAYERFWSSGLDRLERMLSDEDAERSRRIGSKSGKGDQR